MRTISAQYQEMFLNDSLSCLKDRWVYAPKFSLGPSPPPGELSRAPAGAGAGTASRQLSILDREEAPRAPQRVAVDSSECVRCSGSVAAFCA